MHTFLEFFLFKNIKKSKASDKAEAKYHAK
jgi:hypothetical protein